MALSAVLSAWSAQAKSPIQTKPSPSRTEKVMRKATLALPAPGPRREARPRKRSYSATPFARSSCQTFSGVIGMSM